MMEEKTPSTRTLRSTPKLLVEGAISNSRPRTRSKNSALTPSLGYDSTPRSRTRVTRGTPIVSVKTESRILRKQSLGKEDSPNHSAGGKYKNPESSKRCRKETPKPRTQVVNANQERDALVGTLCLDGSPAGSIPGASCLIEVRSTGHPDLGEVDDSVLPGPSEIDAAVPTGPNEVGVSLPSGSGEVAASSRTDPSEVGTSVPPFPSEACASLPPCTIEIGALLATGPSEEGASGPAGPSEIGVSVALPPSELCTLVGPCQVEADVSVTSCPAKVVTSEAPCLVDVCAVDSSFQGEACASLPTYVSNVGAFVGSTEDGTPEAPVVAEGCDFLVPAKEGTLGAEVEATPLAATAMHDAGVLPITMANPVTGKVSASGSPVPQEGATSHTHGYAEVEQSSTKISATRDQLSVDIFNTTVETFLEKLVEAGSYQRFAKCYERFYKFQPEMTRSIYDQFISQLQTSFKDEIREIKEEGNLEALLHSLDKIKDEAKSSVQPAWRPSGIPEEDLQSTLVPYYLQQKDYMRKLLKEKESENAKLAESVLAGRARIAALQEQIQKRTESWKAVSKAQRELVMSLQEPKPEKPRWDP